MQKFRTVVLPIVLLIGVAISMLADRGSRVSHAPRDGGRPVAWQAPGAPRAAESGHGAQILQAFQNRQSNVQVHGAGTVSRMLPDDNEGSRHRKFILTLPAGNKFLIAHNIDLAPRISALTPGDLVEFYGVYEWNEKGGVVHWTHRDPAGRHLGGWLKHNGRTYQ